MLCGNHLNMYEVVGPGVTLIVDNTNGNGERSPYLRMSLALSRSPSKRSVTVRGEMPNVEGLKKSLTEFFFQVSLLF